MILNHQIQGVLAQLRQHARGMAQTHRRFAVSEETFEQVIDGEIAGGANQHFVAAAHGLADQLDKRCRLAGARWAVNDGDIPRTQGEAHRRALRLIERNIQWSEVERGAERRRYVAEQNAAQLGEAVAVCRAGAVERLPLAQTGRFIVRDIQTIQRMFFRRLLEGDAHEGVAALADDAAPAVRAALRRQQHRASRLQARPRQGLIRIALAQCQQHAPAQASVLVAGHEIEETIAALLGLARTQTPYTLQNLPGFRLGFQLQQVGEALEMIDRHRQSEKAGERGASAPC